MNNMERKSKAVQQQILVLPGRSGTERPACAGSAEGAAVFVHLHYRDTLDKYFTYMEHIPESVPVYISSSDTRVGEEAGEYASKRVGKTTVLHKENRGRDITALLVTFREEMLKYEYVCFLHDKMWKSESEKEDVELWIDNLWGNLLGRDEGYFHEVLAAFGRDGSLGLLVPPEPVGSLWTPRNSWNERNVSLVRRLAEELGIHADIDPDITRQPIALGTCFWARTSAIRKILLKKWTYGDFDDEPLPENAKSYAVERIFGYLAEDAGYRACTVMDGAYAAIYLEFLIGYRRNVFQATEGNQLFGSPLGTSCLKGLREYVSGHEPVYIYGAGARGMEVYRYLDGMGRQPQGFLISREDRDYSRMPVPVQCIDQLPYEAGMGIVVAVGRRSMADVVNVLEERGIRNYYCMA